MLSCNQQKTGSSIEGNWWSCARNGDYHELYIQGNKFKFTNDFGLNDSVWKEFTLNNDTFTYVDATVWSGLELRDTLLERKVVIVQIDNDNFKFSYTGANEGWIWTRLDEEISFNAKSEEFLDGVKLRSQERKCLDVRHDSEKLKDGIYFEF